MSAAAASPERTAPAGDWRRVDWPAHRRTLELPGAHVSYVDLGSGDPPVLFVHGLGAQWQVWLANLPGVAAFRRVLAVDLPGFGASERLDGRPVSIRGYAEVLDRLCDRLRLERVVVVGNSMGGFVATELALCRPARVGGLVLVDAAGLVPTRSERWRALPFLRAMVLLGARVGASGRAIAARPGLRRAALSLVANDPRRLPADLTYEALLAPPGPDTREALEASFSYLTPDWGERLRSITAPTLIIWGEGDAIIPVRHAREWARLIPHARVKTFPGTGHIPMVEAPAAFNSVLLEFLESIGGDDGQQAR